MEDAGTDVNALTSVVVDKLPKDVLAKLKRIAADNGVPATNSACVRYACIQFLRSQSI